VLLSGGTKFVCAAGTAPDNLVKTWFATTGPDETLEKAVDFFKDFARMKPLLEGIPVRFSDSEEPFIYLCNYYNRLKLNYFWWT
jgi:hypothetical protein